ncbi:MAG TPA: lytic murein transglycosylase [Gaiellaceae bacterium]|nr:lytic murein transglycosylase [Gaiellaceae bacterium]
MLRPLVLVGLAAVVAGTLAGTVGAQTFSVVAGGGGLPSYTEPNGPGAISVPTPLSTPPARPEQRSYDQLLALWQQAGSAYGVPWEVLGAINKIESAFGSNMGPSSAGAVGWMQFMPETWARWGMDADGDGLANPWDPEDAIYAAARYLAAAGAHSDLSRAIFAYNHAQWYVDDVLELAAELAEGGGFEAGSAPAPAGSNLVFQVDDVEQRLAAARRAVTRARQALVRGEERIEELEWAVHAAEQRAGNGTLTDAEFRRAEATVTRVTLGVDEAEVEAGRLEERLAAAVARLETVKAEAAAIAFTAPETAAPAVPTSSAGYVFPVAGGASAVSVARDHHDYPAADIAAPEGSPIYAHTDGVVLDAFSSPNGRCGIGLTLRTADGDYVYCHFAYLEPDVVSGAAVAAGTPVGLVGSTGNSTGPHLHLQLSPASRYPQNEPWFEGFAGTAFSWQGEDAPAPAPRVFRVERETRVVTFTP